MVEEKQGDQLEPANTNNMTFFKVWQIYDLNEYFFIYFDDVCKITTIV